MHRPSQNKDEAPPVGNEPDNEEKARNGPNQTRIRFLAPATCRIHVGKHGALHVTIPDDQTYGGVYAAYAFPVTYSDQYISLIQSNPDGQDVEVGMIRDLKEFLWDQADLVRQALARRYFIHTITRIHHVGFEHGLVAFDVETDKGRASFLLRWKGDRAVDYGRHGKVLIDVDENRYVIPDLDQLSPGEQADFTRIIYW